MANIAYTPFTIASGAALSSVVDIGGTSRIVGISIHGTWTANLIAFQGYAPDTSTSTNPINPVSDTGAKFDWVRDDAGVAVTVGTTATGATAALYFALGMTTNRPASLEAVRFLKVASVSAAGAAGVAPTTGAQSQAVTGYLICRFD